MMQTHTPPPAMQQVTIELPTEIVERARESLSNGNLAEAVREALREALHRQACEKLLALRGKVKFEMTWQELKALDD